MRYTEEQRQIALKLYDETHSVSKVIHRLGYPSKMGMYTWIGIRNRPLWQKGVRKRLINTPKHPLHPPLSLKMEVLHRCFENGEEVQKLKAQMQDMQMEIDILKETLNVLKKDPGVDITVLKNRERLLLQ